MIVDCCPKNYWVFSEKKKTLETDKMDDTGSEEEEDLGFDDPFFSKNLAVSGHARRKGVWSLDRDVIIGGVFRKGEERIDDYMSGRVTSPSTFFLL